MKDLMPDEITEFLLLKKDDNMVDKFLSAMSYVMKDNSKLNIDDEVLTINKLGEVITLKITFGKNYVLLTNGTSKIQIVYGSKSNTEKNLSNRIMGLIEPIINGREEDWLSFSNKVKCDFVGDDISDKLGLPATKSKVKGENEYYYRIKTEKFESLHIKDDSVTIKNIRFDDKLSSFKDVNIDNISSKINEAREELDRRIEEVNKILRKLNT